MRECHVDVAGGRLYLVDQGDGRPLVLLHEGIVDLRAWDGLVPFLVDAGLRVIRYDRRGHGRSETEDVEYSNRSDLIAVLDTLGLERAVLVAGSAGGQIAIDAAIEHPARIDGIVALGAGLGGYEIDLRPEELALFEAMERLEDADPPDAAAIADLDVRVWVDGIGQPVDRVPSEVREAVRAMDRALWQPGRTGGRPVPLRPPAAERLDELRCPVLAAAGELDVSDVVATAHHLEASAPDARAVIVPGVAHMIALERPGLVADLVVGFVRALG